MTFLNKLTGAAFAALMLWVALPTSANATAIGVDRTFYFTGDCDDCAGPGGLTTVPGANLGDGFTQPVTGTLVLTDFVANTSLDSSNFVSFTYNGSSIVDAFTITAADLDYFTGMLDDAGNVVSPVGDSLQIAWLTSTLSVPSCEGQVICRLVVYPESNLSSPGEWVLEGTSPFDIGLNGSFAGAAPVSEPATLALFGLGLAGLGIARRRKAA